MPYIGSVPTTSFTSLAKQDITGNGGTDYTLSNAVTNANDVAVFLNNVRQEPTEAYTASGSTLSMTGAIHSSDNFYVIFLGQAIQTSNPPDGSVSTSQIANDSVTSAKTNFVSTSSVAGLQIKGDGTTDGTLQLNCSQNSHGIKLKSPNHGAGQSYTLTFPPTAPSADKALITDGSGNLSFGDAGGGKVLQVVETRRTSQLAFTSTSYTGGGIALSITPSSSSSKILLNFFTSNYITNAYIVTTIFRIHGSTNLNLETSSTQGLTQQHSAGGSQGVPTSLMLLDVPNTTDSIMYMVKLKSPTGAQAYMGINNSPSILVAQEIGA